MDTNKERINKALQQIQSALEPIQDLFGEKITTKSIMEMDNKKATQYLRRVQGIITNFNDSNSGKKLEQLVNFLKAIEHRSKEGS